MSTDDLITEVKRDHRELETFYDNFKRASTDEESNKWFHQFVWELSRHSVGEELVMYPLMETINAQGKALADDSRKEHHKVKELLLDASKEKDSDAFISKMTNIMEDLTQHIKKEETDDLVFLSDNVTPDNLRKAGKSFSMKKKLAPTRPHPTIPEKPVALEAALGLLIAPIDKFRDLFTEFPAPENA